MSAASHRPHAVRPLAVRRRLLAGAAALGSVVASRLARAADEQLAPTPAMTEGPFYPEAFPATPRERLIEGRLRSGTPLALDGSVRDAAGRALAGVRVEIWQCDGDGHYHHSRDSRTADRDPAFLGYGWVLTDAGGRFAFETIRPVPYPGRTPHIHFAAIARDGRRLVTQMFVAGDPGNERDGLWWWLSPEARQRVTVPVLPAPSAASDASSPSAAASASAATRAPARWAGRFDIVMRT